MSALPISELFSSAPRSVIKSVQRGVIAFSVSYPSVVEVAISPVDMGKAFLNLLGFGERGASVGSYLTLGLKNSNTIRGVSTLSLTVSIPWEVVEYY